MKVAFDCQGTLQSRDPKVVKLYRWFESKGCEMTIWTNGGYRLAQEVKNHLKLGGDPSTKTCTWDLDCTVEPMSHYMDVAVDDDCSQTYLAAKNFIWVHDIPDDESKFEETFGWLFNVTPENSLKQSERSPSEVS